MENILITGGTGTFGNAFTEHVLSNNLAERVVILSRDEKKQQDMRVRFSDPRLRFFLGDVRDRRCLRRAFNGVDAVIHAAALKQVDRSALDIAEFKRTNVDGTENVLDVAHDCGVGKVIVLSTDKAVSSVTPYGATKALCEWLAVAANVYGPTRSCACRYGNIEASRGSVLDLWELQNAKGEPLTLTDKRMTRFWLRIEDAVNLVLLALERMGGGEIFVPKGVRHSSIVDLARLYFGKHPIKFMGKRSYEKIHEELVSAEEIDRLHDCGDVYVLAPMHVRWEPGPWGLDYPLVAPDFRYRSDGG